MWSVVSGKFHVPLLPVPTAGFLPAGRGLVGQLGGLSAAVSAAPLPVTATAAPVQPPARAPSAPAAPAPARSTPPAAASPTPSLGRDRDSLPSPCHSQVRRATRALTGLS